MRRIIFGVCLFALGACGLCEAQQIYVVRGSRGSMTFTSRKPIAGAQFKVFQPSRAAFSICYGLSSFWRPVARKSNYDLLISGAAQQQKLDPALVRAVVHVESNFDAGARSYRGAMGLMQLMPGTARRFGVSNAYLPEQNVSGGTRYLRFLLDRYSGNETLAIAAYNAGEGAVDGFGNIPPYAETRTYVKRVLQMKELYSRADGSGDQSKPVLVE